MKLNVAIIRGGIGHEYDISLQSGARVLSAIDRKKYQPIDVLVDKDGVWHADGTPLDPSNLKHIADVVFNLLHGPYGEDGLMSQFLEDEGISYIGSSALGSRMAFNKEISKDKFRNLGLRTPASHSIHLSKKIKEASDDELINFVLKSGKEIFEHVSPPWILKPSNSSFSIGVRYARDFDELVEGLVQLLSKHNSVIVEHFVKGREISVSVADNFKNEDNYVFPPIDIIKNNKILDYENRNSGEYKHAESPLSGIERQDIIDAARKIHQAFDLSDWSTIDFILNKNGLYALEVDNMPGFSKHSMYPKALEIAGVDFPDFIDHLIQNSLKQKS